MPRTKSSRKWLKEHFSDPYVKKAQAAGLRSRATFKLQELFIKDPILKKNMLVVDLGAAPGGWAQYVVDIIKPNGKIWALDILSIKPIPGVEIIQGDFTESDVLDQLLVALNHKPIDLVLSDMAPNISGLDAVDQPRAMYLVELALEFCEKVLKPGGSFVVKVFQGRGFDEFLLNLRKCFKKVNIRKPPASRKRSKEVYLVATGFNEVV